MDWRVIRHIPQTRSSPRKRGPSAFQGYARGNTSRGEASRPAGQHWVPAFAGMSGAGVAWSSDAAFQRDGDEFLGLDGEFHRELLEHVLDEAVGQHVQGLLLREAALRD